GADMVLVVTEPTQSGQHDLQRVVELTRHFGIKTMVCINKWDLNAEMAGKIEGQVRQEGVAMAGNVRYDNAFTQSQINKLSVVEYTDNGVADDIRKLWENVFQVLNS
ncbi:MAG: hypothetical protein KAJ46_04815, partial [Sedimentisphaerales bacterium]|nr:hypothetical protein [Sedimentisphaerales bacterium]